MSARKTQNGWVLNELLRGWSLTALQALQERGIARLGARIWELKRAGFPVAAETVRVVKADGTVAHVKAYRLISEAVRA